MLTIEHQNAVTIIHEELAVVMAAVAPLLRDGAQVLRCIHQNGLWRIDLTHRTLTEPTQEAQTAT